MQTIAPRTGLPQEHWTRESVMARAQRSRDKSTDLEKMGPGAANNGVLALGAKMRGNNRMRNRNGGAAASQADSRVRVILYRADEGDSERLGKALILPHTWQEFLEVMCSLPCALRRA
jgi:hypothetical protein